jgi:hypothetical protein
MNVLKKFAAIIALTVCSTSNVMASTPDYHEFHKERVSGAWSTSGMIIKTNAGTIALCGTYTKIERTGNDGPSLFAVNIRVSDWLNTPNNGAQSYYLLNWPGLSRQIGNTSKVRVSVTYRINGVSSKYEDMWTVHGDTISLDIPSRVIEKGWRRASNMKIKVYVYKNPNRHYWVNFNMNGTNLHGEYLRQCMRDFEEKSGDSIVPQTK